MCWRSAGGRRTFALPCLVEPWISLRPPCNRIEAADRAGRERQLRYCARPPFALERLRELGGEHLLYERTKPGLGGTGPQILTPLQLLDRLAALVPPPRVHCHRYFGVLAPNAPLRAAVTALAPAAAPTLAV